MLLFSQEHLGVAQVLFGQRGRVHTVMQFLQNPLGDALPAGVGHGQGAMMFFLGFGGGPDFPDTLLGLLARLVETLCVVLVRFAFPPLPLLDQRLQFAGIQRVQCCLGVSLHRLDHGRHGVFALGALPLLLTQ